MPEERSYSVGFTNQNMVILWHAELTGQISDGFWENATPRDHWKIPCKAKAYVAQIPETLGTDWKLFRYYDFANVDLLDVVADRMIEYVKIYTAFPDIDREFEYHHDLEYVSSPRKLRETLHYAYDNGDMYYRDKLTRIRILFDVLTDDDLAPFAEMIDAIEYSMSDLKRDLGQMKKIMHLLQRGAFGHVEEQNIALWERYHPRTVVTRTGGRKKQRQYHARVEEMLTTGAFTKDMMIKMVMEEFPETNLATLKTFFTDLKNPKYSAFEKKVVVNSNGKWVFEFIPS